MKESFQISALRLGAGAMMMTWSNADQILAVYGFNRKLSLFNVFGELKDQVTLSTTDAECIFLCWSYDDRFISLVFSDKPNELILFEPSTRKIAVLVTKTKCVTFLVWSKIGNTLAAGGENGTLCLCDPGQPNNTSIQNLVDIHDDAILSGNWSNNRMDMLMTSGRDKSLCLLTKKGSLLRRIETSGIPTLSLFIHPAIQHLVLWTVLASYKDESCIVLFSHTENSSSEEKVDSCTERIEFKPDFGNIFCLNCVEDGCILVGFDLGQFLLVSLGRESLGHQLASVNIHNNKILDFACGNTLQYLCILTNRRIYKILSMSGKLEIEQFEFNILTDSNPHTLIESPDCLQLSLGTDDGVVISYMTRAPTLFAIYHDTDGANIAFLSGVKEVTVVECESFVECKLQQTIKEYQKVILDLQEDADCLSLNGKRLLSTSRKNVFLYCLSSLKLLASYTLEVPLPKTVLLTPDNTVFLLSPSGQMFMKNGSLIETESKDCNGFDTLFENTKVACCALTPDCLILGDCTGQIIFFSLCVLDLLSELTYQHTHAILSLNSNLQSTRVIFVDETRQCHVYESVTKTVTKMRPSYVDYKFCCWDVVDSYNFSVLIGSSVRSYCYFPCTLDGASTKSHSIVNVDDIDESVYDTEVPNNYLPLLLFRGYIFFLIIDKSVIVCASLSSYSEIHKFKALSDKDPERHAVQLIALGKYATALEVLARASFKDISKIYDLLHKRAIESLDLSVALEASRCSKNFLSTQYLERLFLKHDINLIRAFLFYHQGNFEKAERHFVNAQRYSDAYLMWKQLGYFRKCIELSPYTDVDNTEMILFYAKHLVYSKKMHEAYKLLKEYLATDSIDEHCVYLLKKALIPITIQIGKVKEGLLLLFEVNNEVCYTDSISILVQLEDSEEWMPQIAQIYEKLSNYEKAFDYYVASKNLIEADRLVRFVTKCNSLSKYAKVKEEIEQNYEVALQYYDSCGEYENCVRLYLNHFQDHEKAYELTLSKQLPQCAGICAEYALGFGHFEQAIKLLVLSGRHQEALDLSIVHDEKQDTVRCFHDQLLSHTMSDSDPAEFLSIFKQLAQFYESKSNIEKAAQCYEDCGHYFKAITLYLNTNTHENINRAVRIVGQAQNDILTHTLIDYLTGETDNEAKDPVYIFKLYLGLNKFEEATKTARILAEQAIEKLQLNECYTILTELKLGCINQSIKLADDLKQIWNVLHSYFLVKIRLSLSDEVGAGMLLNRVCKFIDHFAFVTRAKILTSTVLLLYKIGNIGLSVKWAVTILKSSEIKPLIEPKHLKKIQNIIRQKGRQKPSIAIAEEMEPSAYTESMTPVYSLSCALSRQEIPLCIITGKIVLTADYCVCPNSGLSARYSAYIAFIEATTRQKKTAIDPVLSKAVTLKQIKKLSPEEALVHIKSILNID